MNQERRDVFITGGVYIVGGVICGFLGVGMGVWSHSPLTIFLGIAFATLVTTLGVLMILPERYNRAIDRVIQRILH